MPYRLLDSWEQIKIILIAFLYMIVSHFEVNILTYFAYTFFVLSHCVAGGLVVIKYEPSKYKLKVNILKLFKNYANIFFPYMVATALMLKGLGVSETNKELIEQFNFVSGKGINLLTLMYIISSTRHMYKYRTGIDLPDRDFISLLIKAVHKAGVWSLDNTLGRLAKYGNCSLSDDCDDIFKKNKDHEDN